MTGTRLGSYEVTVKQDPYAKSRFRRDPRFCRSVTS